MLFDSGSVETVQEPFPGWAIDAFAVITEFGDPLFFHRLGVAGVQSQTTT